ncbi:hypothetical protein AB8B21_07530 [Tardiphaga sp. 866_E4_N2_1]|uniref:hypothetical protein n=1 Tax=unclassified Tardiphaga TaxID=2631404 RepID=UPI003F259F30
MSYQDIRIAGDIAEALEAWVVRGYGNVVDLEVGGINEGDFAAVGYAAVANEGAVEAVVLLIRHDPEGGPDRYRVKDVAESEGPVVDFCPERILDQLTPTEDHLANHWRERCRERVGLQSGRPAFSLNS